jgi:hypothetical protein
MKSRKIRPITEKEFDYYFSLVNESEPVIWRHSEFYLGEYFRISLYSNHFNVYKFNNSYGIMEID